MQDVYKRQVPKSARSAFFGSRMYKFALVLSRASMMVNRKYVFPPPVPPVSYTHLDVYKRQGHGRTTFPTVAPRSLHESLSPDWKSHGVQSLMAHCKHKRDVYKRQS